MGSIHWSNRLEAHRALEYLAYVEGPGKAVVRHALESILKRAELALEAEAVSQAQE